MKPQGFRYFAGLDGVRALAIVLVLGCHSLDPFFHAEGGAVGVNMFFTLSGFLITGLLLTELATTGALRFGSFYLRRCLRLLPALLLLLVLVAVLPNDLPGSMSRVAAEPAALVYVGNYVQAFAGWGSLGLLSHTWSLSVEEQFYLLWPFALAWLAASGRLERWLPRLILAFVACRAVLGTAGVPAIGIWLPGAADQLLAGALLAVVYLRQGTGWARPAWVGWSAIGAIAAIAVAGSISEQGMQGPFANDGGATVAAAAAALLIAHLVSGASSRLAGLLTLPPIVRLGRVSYGLYLFHYPIFKWVQTYHWPDRFETIGVEYALAGLLTAFSWFVVERPALRLKRRIADREAVATISLPGRASPSPAS